MLMPWPGRHMSEMAFRHAADAARVQRCVSIGFLYRVPTSFTGAAIGMPVDTRNSDMCNGSLFLPHPAHEKL